MRTTAIVTSLMYFNSDKVLATRKKQKNKLFFSVSGTKALSEGQGQYISDPGGMIDVRSTASAPKQNPWANSENNRPV